MKTNKDICPMTGLKVNDPCVVYSCPSNAIHHKSGVSCVLMNMNGLSIKNLAEVLNEDSSRLKKTLENQVKVLGKMMNELKDLLEISTTNSCPDCGYIRKCQSSTLCMERKNAIDLALSNLRIKKSVMNDIFILTRTGLWQAVIQSRLSFLPEKITSPLKELLSAKDMKG